MLCSLGFFVRTVTVPSYMHFLVSDKNWLFHDSLVQYERNDSPDSHIICCYFTHLITSTYMNIRIHALMQDTTL